MAERIRIAVVDDHPMFRDGVVHTLSSAGGMEVVGVGVSAAEAIKVAESELPDVMLIDINMPGGGIEAARQIAQRCPIVKVMMLTVSESEDDVQAALRGGARGYVLKGISGQELIRTVRAIHDGEAYVTPALAVRLLAQMREPEAALAVVPERESLTKREEQILELVAEGLLNREIAVRLDLSEKTVKHHMTNILQKLQVRNRVEAALAARHRAAPARA